MDYFFKTWSLAIDHVLDHFFIVTSIVLQEMIWGYTREAFSTIPIVYPRLPDVVFPMGYNSFE
jgi:hypothetical protein